MTGRAFGRSSPVPIVSTPIADNLVLLSGAGANVVALTSPDGVLLVDGGLEERSKDLLKEVAKLPGGRHVHTLINTHWHWNHTGSNERLAKDKARIVAHENTKLWLGADFYVDWEKPALHAAAKGRMARPRRFIRPGR